MQRSGPAKPVVKKRAEKKSGRLDLLGELEAVADERKAQNLAWFFKTGPGEYGEGDVFLGITVPMSRKIALRYTHLAAGGHREAAGVASPRASLRRARDSGRAI